MYVLVPMLCFGIADLTTWGRAPLLHVDVVLNAKEGGIKMRGFLFGMCLGAIAGVLYAPATGNRTRSLLRDKYTKYSNDIPEFIDQKSRDLSNRMEGVKHDLDGMLTQAKEQAGPLKEKMRGMRDDIKNRVDELRDSA